MNPNLNVNKQRNSTTLDCLSKAKTGKYGEFSFPETKSLSSYAGTGCHPTRKFTHSSTFINYISMLK